MGKDSAVSYIRNEQLYMNVLIYWFIYCETKYEDECIKGKFVPITGRGGP
jgi:hypothetical protein